MLLAEIGTWILFMLRFLTAFDLVVIVKSMYDHLHDWFDQGGCYELSGHKNSRHVNFGESVPTN
ncbi:MAG: hypothetical protein ABF657_05745 [Lentilactobacillus diolivorans]|uniref:hypothetical protein n=1 Tax=Lentilactobacillus diolivorans TaxID=179838 RepID=UPI0039ECC869